MSLLVLNPAPLVALAEDLDDPVAIASMLSTFCDSVESLRIDIDDAWSRHEAAALRQTLRDLSASAVMFGAEHLARGAAAARGGVRGRAQGRAPLRRGHGVRRRPSDRAHHRRLSPQPRRSAEPGQVTRGGPAYGVRSTPRRPSQTQSTSVSTTSANPNSRSSNGA